MHPTLAHLLRPLASLALAVALAAPIALAPDAQAQFGRQLPSPVSAAQLEQMLRDVGMPETTKDAALPLHEAYFERFREFEKRELDPLLAKPSDNPFDLARSVDDAKKEADLRRRAFQRAAQLDGQLADEIGGILPSDHAWRTQMLKDSLSRRRCAALGPSIGLAGKPLGFSMRGAPVITTLETDTQRMVNLSLELYEAELTRRLQRYADASFDRIVKAAELREELGVGAPPSAPEGGEPTAAPGDEWFRKMQEVQRRANEDVDSAVARIRRLHRDCLDQIMPLMPALSARAARDYMISSMYPMLRSKSEFDTVYEAAVKMHERGEIDDVKWAPAFDLAESNEHSGRPLILSMMDLVDKRAGTSEFGVIAIGESFGGATDDPESRSKSDALRKQLTSLEQSNAATLRAMLGMAEPEHKDEQVGRGSINLADILGGGGAGVEVGAIAVVGGVGGGDMVVLGGEELGEGGFVFSALGGGGNRLARPMTREELDALAEKLGFNGDSRPVFDEIAARCAEARNGAEQEFKPPQASQTLEGEGGISFTISLGGDDPAVTAGGDNAKLAEAIDAAEETMFDELKAAAAVEKADALEAARRARARVRLLTDETGVQSVDLVKVADGAGLSEAARARIRQDLRGWDESSVGALRTMKSQLKSLIAEREEIFRQSTEEVREDDGKGSVNVNRSVRIGGETADRMQKLEAKIASTRSRVGDANRGALAGMLVSLEGDQPAQRALRRSFLRAEFPQIYRMPRDLDPYFHKAEGIEGVSATAKSTIDAMRAEWIEAREARCEEFCLAQQKGEAATSGDPGEDMKQMQARMRERKKLREDLEQIESTCFRKLQDALLVDVGPEKAKELGELPARRRPAAGTIQFGR